MSFKVPLISSIKANTPATVWTRPGDWITITDAASEVQFLVNDTGSAVFTLRTNYTKPAAQNFYIDWGDGVTTTISAIGQTDTAHTYSIGTGTACTLGYTTWKIRVYVDSGATISQCQFIQGTVNGVTQVPIASIGLLEAYYGDGIGITSYADYFYSSSLATQFTGIGSFWLKYVKLPANSDNVTSMAQTFYGCVNLARVTMPTSMSTLTACNFMFYRCFNLETITFATNATAITTLSNAFNLNYNLTTVILPTTLNSVTTLLNAFYNCYNLNNITLPALGSCTNYSSCFEDCYGLQNIKLTSWTSTATGITLNNFITNCRTLSSFIFPATATVGTTFSFSTSSGLFSACYSIPSIVYPEYFGGAAVTSVTAGFFSVNSLNNCTKIVYPTTVIIPGGTSFSITDNQVLTSVTMPTSVTGCTTIGSITNNPRLTSITLPATVNNPIIFPTMSSNFGLQSLTIPSGWTLTGTMSDKLALCYSLQSVTFPASINSVTSWVGLFQNCANLTTVTMPTSMTGITSLNTTFSGCKKLTSITFPATMNTCSSLDQTFGGCTSLLSVTLPTSMTNLATVSRCFQNCASIKDITLPATVKNTMTLYQAFINCSSLITITLPNTQLISMVDPDLTGLFQNCPNLTTITNMDKIGNPSATGAQHDVSSFLTLSPQLTSTVDLYPRLRDLKINGTVTYRSKMSAVRLRNIGASQWGGSSPQIDVSYTDMSTAQLNTLFADMAAQPVVVSKTINITSATGAAGLSAGDRLVITSRGWTITG